LDVPGKQLARTGKASSDVWKGRADGFPGAKELRGAFPGMANSPSGLEEYPGMLGKGWQAARRNSMVIFG
jgi:hypothetical protein